MIPLSKKLKVHFLAEKEKKRDTEFPRLRSQVDSNPSMSGDQENPKILGSTKPSKKGHQDAKLRRFCSEFRRDHLVFSPPKSISLDFGYVFIFLATFF